MFFKTIESLFWAELANENNRNKKVFFTSCFLGLKTNVILNDALSKKFNRRGFHLKIQQQPQEFLNKKRRCKQRLFTNMVVGITFFQPT